MLPKIINKLNYRQRMTKFALEFVEPNDMWLAEHCHEGIIDDEGIKEVIVFLHQEEVFTVEELKQYILQHYLVLEDYCKYLKGDEP